MSAGLYPETASKSQVSCSLPICAFLQQLVVLLDTLSEKLQKWSRLGKPSDSHDGRTDNVLIYPTNDHLSSVVQVGRSTRTSVMSVARQASDTADFLFRAQRFGHWESNDTKLRSAVGPATPVALHDI